MKPNPRIAILASGEGTTAEAFIEAGAKGLINAQVSLIICNNQDAGIFNKISDLNKKYGLDIKTLHVSKKNYPAAASEKLNPGQQTAAEENAILEALKQGNFDLIVLMGYMKKIGPRLVAEFGWRASYKSPYQAVMLNTHPGLLPATKGLYGIYVQEYVLKNKLPYGGQTLHVVAEDYDEGPVIAEHKVTVHKGDTPESLFDSVKAIEKKFLPKDIDNFIKNRREYLAKETN
jgi:phosphoribosylglycinamide formyltransferase 1